jgi:hypothetical protein
MNKQHVGDHGKVRSGCRITREVSTVVGVSYRWGHTQYLIPFYFHLFVYVYLSVLNIRMCLRKCACVFVLYEGA